VNVILLCDSTVYSCDTVTTWSVLSSLLWWFLYCKFFVYSIVTNSRGSLFAMELYCTPKSIHYS
jgi:hypothetical protein